MQSLVMSPPVSQDHSHDFITGSQMIYRVFSQLWPDAQMYPPYEVVEKAVVLAIHCKPKELLTHKIGAALCWLLQLYV